MSLTGSSGVKVKVAIIFVPCAMGFSPKKLNESGESGESGESEELEEASFLDSRKVQDKVSPRRSGFGRSAGEPVTLHV